MAQLAPCSANPRSLQAASGSMSSRCGASSSVNGWTVPTLQPALGYGNTTVVVLQSRQADERSARPVCFAGSGHRVGGGFGAPDGPMTESKHCPAQIRHGCERRMSPQPPSNLLLETASLLYQSLHLPTGNETYSCCLLKLRSRSLLVQGTGLLMLRGFMPVGRCQGGSSTVSLM